MAGFCQGLALPWVPRLGLAVILLAVALAGLACSGAAPAAPAASALPPSVVPTAEPASVERAAVRDILIEQVVIQVDAEALRDALAVMDPGLDESSVVQEVSPAVESAAGDSAAVASGGTLAPLTAAAEPTVPEELPEPVTIGAVFAYTGALSASSVVMRNGVDLAIYLLNEAGGVLGRPVRALHKDSGSDPEIAVESARALVQNNRIDLLIGPLSSSATLAVAREVTAPNQALQITPSATSPELTFLADGDFLFRTTPQDGDQGRVLARLARESFATAGVLYVDNHYGRELSAVFKEEFEAGGGRVTAMVPVPVEIRESYFEALEKVTADDPEVVMAITYNDSAEVYLKEALDGGLADTFMFVDGTKNQETFDRINDRRLDGMMGVAPGADSPGRAVFSYLYQQRFGEEPGTVFIAESFDAVALLALAVEKAGSVEGPAARDALRQVANPPGAVVGPGDLPRALELIRAGQEINYEGAGGSQDFDENGDVFGSFEVWTLVDGRITSTGRFITP